MKLIVIISLIGIVGGTLDRGAGVSTTSGANTIPASRRDISVRDASRAMDLLFNGQVQSALEYLETLSGENGGQPLYLLIRARLRRELLPVDDENKKQLGEIAAGLYADLDSVIAVCGDRIKGGDEDPRLFLYRGWARMLKSHVRTFEKSLWSAGREAKKGKKDLEHYLDAFPRDPIANSLMGAFLYFADTLPAAYKFVSKLLFLPGGDRDRGLEMMELAVGYNSLVERDNRLVLYSVYIGFEGRYEEGLQGFEVLFREDPFHSTFLRPAVMLTVLKPRYTEAVGLELDGRVAVIDSLPGDETDQATYSLLHFFRGYADRFYYPERAHERLERMVEVNPDHPDWVTGYATFELGRMHAARGNVEEANRLFLGVINNERSGYLHADARSMIRALTKSPAPTAPVDSVIVGIYAGEEGAVRAVEHFRGLAEPSATDLFYLGEALLATGDDDGALDAYIGALDADAPLWDEEFQLMAATRAGELTGALGDYAIAAGYYKAARRLWSKEFLLDWVLEGRQRYFSRLDDGKELPPASWFAAQ